MGALEGDREAYDDEKPRHRVSISRDILVGKYPVTQGLYESVVGSNPSKFKGANRPVERVSWYAAVEFCNKLSALEGREPVYTIDGTNVSCNFVAKGYRLLTEAEWEYCARSGQRFKYSGSDDMDEVAWYPGNSGGETHPVGLKKPNGFGLYDMSGNVGEWCWDWYGDYSSGTQVDPQGPTSGSNRVLRGCSWFFKAQYMRVSNRSSSTPALTYNFLGFRLGLTP
jgi:formylglycine-generating enzyme required for sulfatase activity